MTDRQNRRRRSEPPEPENGGRLLIQILICATIICGFMFFKDVPVGGTTVQTVANRFINYTSDLKDTFSKLTETVIPASGRMDK